MSTRAPFAFDEKNATNAAGELGGYSPMMPKRAWMPALTVLFLMLVFAVKGVLLTPPSPPAVPGPGAFNTDRALARLTRILGDQRPHPVDSDANDAVRDRLIAELRAIGLEPRIQEATDCSAIPRSPVVSCSHVRNVIATVGAGAGQHILLNAHYDSTPTGPGAADDGIGVASLLEIAAVLQARPPPRPVTFLFNEGEEFGLNGASAFVREEALSDDIDSLINVESRGVSGPALMFETSAPNGAAISVFANAAHRPFANSLSMDFARLIPNTTDVVKFRPAGWTILNFAIIGNETRYHTPGDTIAALDRASLHHVGSQALAAARAMSVRYDARTARTYVFTDVAGRMFLRLRLPIAAIAICLMIGLALAQAYRRKALGKPLLLAFGMTVGGILAAALAGTAAGFIRPGDYWRGYPLITYLAVYSTMLLAMGSIWRRWGANADRWPMRTSAWLLTLLLGGAISLLLPGALIFFLAAPAVALAGVLLANRVGWAPRLLVVAALIQLLMFAELLALIEMLLIDGPIFAVAPLAALAALPLIIETEAARLRAIAIGLSATAALLWGAALLMPRASADRPAAFTIDYFRDDTTGQASWAVASKQAPLPASFPGKWRKAIPAYSTRTRWTSGAPLIDIPRPEVRLVRSEPVANGRRVLLAFAANGANAISIRFAERTPLQRLGTPGETLAIPAKGKPDKALLRCSGRSCDGMIVEILLADRRPVVADLFATRFALPPQGAALAARRPANAHAQYGPDSSIRRRSVKF